MTRRGRVAVAVLTALIVLTIAITASAIPGVGSDLAEVRQATAAFHSVERAEAAQYGELLHCFESEAGGMGQHYVNTGLLNGVVSATEPEALVYEVTGNGDLKLVAVEYIVPATEVNPFDPPELFGQEFHENTGPGAVGASCLDLEEQPERDVRGLQPQGWCLSEYYLRAGFRSPLKHGAWGETQSSTTQMT